MLTETHLGECDLQNQLCEQFRAELSYLLPFLKHVQKVRMCSIEGHGCKRKDICEQLRGPSTPRRCDSRADCAIADVPKNGISYTREEDDDCETTCSSPYGLPPRVIERSGLAHRGAWAMAEA